MPIKLAAALLAAVIVAACAATTPPGNLASQNCRSVPLKSAILSCSAPTHSADAPAAVIAGKQQS